MHKSKPDNQMKNSPGVTKKVHKHKGVDYQLILGWSISVAAHLIILAIITQIGWAGSGGLRKAAVDVEIIAEDDSAMLDEGGQDRMETAQALNLPELTFTDRQTTETLAQIDVDLKEVELDTQIDLAVTSAELSDSAANIQWAEMAAEGAGSKGRGGASFFGLRASGGKFVFVVDKSGSMGSNSSMPLNTAKQELIRSIQAMDEDMKFYVIFYDSGALPMKETDLVTATQKNKKRCFDWIESITANDGTEPGGAMMKALQLKPDAIWLLSDGEFGQQAVEIIRKNNTGKKIKIHTIAFMSDSGRAILRQIAEENNGNYRFVTAAGKRPR